MACFIAPAAEAIVTTAITKVIESKETNTKTSSNQVRFSSKLKKLNHFLWGGTALLAFEHFWHGEITPFFPFITAAGNSADTAEMLNELSTVGVSMAVLITVMWGVLTVAESIIAKRKSTAPSR